MFNLISKAQPIPHLVLPTLVRMGSPSNRKPKQHPSFFPLFYLYSEASITVSLVSTLDIESSVRAFLSWPHCHSLV